MADTTEDSNSEKGIEDEENMYTNDPGNGILDAETGKIKNGDHPSPKDPAGQGDH